jgi:hypothetical protein
MCALPRRVGAQAGQAWGSPFEGIFFTVEFHLLPIYFNFLFFLKIIWAKFLFGYGTGLPVRAVGSSVVSVFHHVWSHTPQI